MQVKVNWTDSARQVRIFLVVAAVLIAIASLVVSSLLVRDLSKEESYNVEVWAEAMRAFDRADENTDLQLVLKILEGNNTIPVAVLDSRGHIQTSRNVRVTARSEADSVAELQRLVTSMRRSGHVIRVEMEGDSLAAPDYIEVCYDESLMLRRLAYYPYVQWSVVLVFILVAVFALMSSRRAEQNKVWVGLSKETAHQLGTPISSLMAWVEVLKESYPEDALLPEMGKDVNRLQRIAERFSKIGSLPENKPDNLNEVVEHVVEYIGKRVSHKVQITTQMPSHPLVVNICAPLFEWVIENLCKNAIDAMEGEGRIHIQAREEEDVFSVEVSDTGKGIPKKRLHTVFKAGYTTKARGWGLGLALCKRIVEEYHEGRIFVKNSEVGNGTTFRIELKKR